MLDEFSGGGGEFRYGGLVRRQLANLIYLPAQKSFQMRAFPAQGKRREHDIPGHRPAA
jgi:hypothetical protein